MSFPPGATEQLMYARKGPDGQPTTEAMLCFLIDGRVEKIMLGGYTKLWEPTEAWVLVQILDIKRMLALDPETRVPVGKLTPGGVELFNMEMKK